MHDYRQLVSVTSTAEIEWFSLKYVTPDHGTGHGWVIIPLLENSGNVSCAPRGSNVVISGICIDPGSVANERYKLHSYLTLLQLESRVGVDLSLLHGQSLLLF